MEFNKEVKTKISLNLSPTSINTYYQSPLLFYLTYIAKVPDDTKVPVCYGISGNIVHDCLEKYANKELDRDGACLHLAKQWIEKNLHNHRDIKNEPLKKEDYLIALINGLNIIDLHDSHVCEELIKFSFAENELIEIGIKGIVDLQANEKSSNQSVVIDYKTSNSISQSKDFERQALFYNYLLYKKGKNLPTKTIFHYLKLGIPKVYSFSQEDIESFEEELKAIADKILSNGTDIKNYSIGEINNLFNSKKQACLNEVTSRFGYSNTRNFIDMRY